MRPLVGFSRRFNERRKVDLPLPDGPITAMTSPSETVVLMSTEHGMLSEALAEMLHANKYVLIFFHSS